MDFIPQTRDHLLEIRVALAEPVIPYDFSNFATFTARHGFAKVSAAGIDSSERARYLQSWFFFGLLAEYLEEDFRIDDFVVRPETSSDCQLLTLKNLQARLLDDEGQPLRLSRWKSHVEPACALAWTKIGEMESLGLLSASPAGETALAVLVLVRTLRIITTGPSRSEDRCAPWDSGFLRARMHTAGWCPQQTAALFDLCDPVVLCYLALLHPVQGHSVSHENCSETACVANNVRLDTRYRHRHVSDSCTCDFVSVDAEAVKDIIRGDGIPLVSIRREEHGRVSLTISKASSRSDYVAISHVWSDGLGNPTANALPQCQLERLSRCLTQMPRESDVSNSNDYFLRGIRFEASPNSKDSPWKRVRSAVFPDHDQKESRFWMDTLCIPVATQTDTPLVVLDVNRLKSMAINQMALIYAGASQVLVLDSGLQSMPVDPSDTASDVEILARLVCSTWMRRCWTLQEGALARKIRFQSASGVVTPLAPTKAAIDSQSLEIANRLVPWLLPWGIKMYLRRRATASREREAEQAGRTNPVVTHLRYRLQDAADRVINLLPRGLQSHNTLGQASPESQLRQFCTVWNSLADRNTTMAEDVPAIFANLLDINAYQILALPPSSRMKAILASLDVLPLDLLFNDGPRSRADKGGLDRWIPSEPSRAKIRLPFSGEGDLSQAVDSGTLAWTHTGDLKCWGRDGCVAVIFNGVDTLRNNTGFIVRLDETVSRRLPKEILVNVTRPEADEWRPGACKKVMLLLDVEDTAIPLGEKRKGCSLFITSLGESEGRSEGNGIQPRGDQPVNDVAAMVGRYDCPLTWRTASPDDLQRLPVVDGLAIKDEWHLTIQCGK